MKSISKLSFLLFAVFYLFGTSTLPLPTAIRWAGSFLLIGCAFLEMFFTGKPMVLTYPRAFLYLVISLIPTILGIGGEATMYAYARIISLFLVIIGLKMFFDMHIWSVEDYVTLIEIYTFVSGFVMILCAFSNNYMNDRLAGLYGNPNTLSGITVFTTVTAISLVIYNKSVPKRIMFLVFAFFSAYSCILTGSRMGIACLTLTFFSFPFVYSHDATVKTRLQQLLMIILIILVAFYVIDRFDIVGIERLFDDTTEDGSTGFSREATWGDVMEIFSQKPMLGWGYTQVTYRAFVAKDQTYNWGMHSSYFMILCEMGIIGSFIMVAFFISYFKGVYRQYKNTHLNVKEARFVKFLALACFLLLLNAYSESFLFSMGSPITVGFWLPFIMLSCYLKKKNEQGA